MSTYRSRFPQDAFPKIHTVVLTGNGNSLVDGIKGLENIKAIADSTGGLYIEDATPPTIVSKLISILDTYEVDPLKCAKCGGTMKIISFIEDDTTIQKILKHCGKWKESIPRPPPQLGAVTTPAVEYVVLDYSFFEQNCN